MKTLFKHIITLVALLICVIGGGGGLYAAHDVYWDPQNGNNSNDGLSANKPKKTWTAARNLYHQKNPNGDSDGCWVYMMSSREITTSDGIFHGQYKNNDNTQNTGHNMRIRRYNFSGSMFICPADTHLQFEYMTIDGGTTWNTAYVAHFGASSTGKSGAIIEAKGRVTISNCTLQNANGRAFLCNNDGTESKDFKLTSVTIQGCMASDGSAIKFQGSNYHNATLTSVTIYGCYATEPDYGGTIRENGGTKTALTLNNCNIYNNKSQCGAGVYWNAGGRAGAVCTIKGNTTIHDNVALKNGGGVYCETRVQLEDNVKIYNNTAKYGAGIYIRSYGADDVNFDGQGSNIEIKENVKVYNNTATVYGGGICMRIINAPAIGYAPNGNALANPSYSLTISSGEISGNKAPKGAGVAILDLATKKNKVGGVSTNEITRKVEIKGGSVYNNETTGSGQTGAGIYIRKYPAAYNNDATDVEYNPVQDYSLAQYEGAGTITVTVSAGTINSNKATNGSGGGMYITNEFYDTNISNACNVTVSGTAQVYGNTCKYDGAGIYLTGGTFTMTGGTIGKSPLTSNGNRADRNGGGFFVNKGVCKVQGGTISYNKATGNGGGFYVDPGSSATTNINSESATTTVSYNEAANGAGAYVNSGTLAIATAATQIQNNTASTSGGGVYVNGGTVTVNAATIASNVAATHGGGIYSSSGTVTLTSAKVNSNVATNGNGGGVYAGSSVTVTSATLTGNEATNGTNGKGGGIYAKATVNIGGTSSALSSLTSNQARLGGGVYADNTSVTIGYANIGNTGAGNSATDGGGVYAAGTVTLNAGTAVQSNTASNDGGGVYVNNATFTMNAGDIGGGSASYGNTAAGGNGGGVYITGNSAKVQVLGGAINYNQAPSSTANKGNGGGIYVASTGTDGTSISGNATINNNTAQQNGGGVYVVDGTFTIGSATISSNTATAYHGGGVYLGNGTFNLNASGVIESNHANSGNGGGVYMAGGTFNHNAGNIGRLYASANTAINGAGLYVNAGSYYSKSTSSTIIGNDASSNGGGIYMNGGNCYLQGGHIGDNGGTQLNEAVNGAGLYMAGTGHFEMTNASSYIRGNHATTSGGGIYMEGGTCSITAGTIGASGYPNQAVNGGGIYAAGGAITVNGGDITYNKATGTNGYGGGIYSYSGTVTVQSGNITYNTAATDGGGIYARGTVNFSNGNINYNTATAGNGGGVYIYSTGTLNVSGTATMTSNSATAGLGGGVYQGGIMTADGSQLFVSGNTNGRAKNNVYLPDGQTIKVGSNISTNVNLGIYTERIATVGNDIPVLTCDNGNQTKLNDIYSAMLTGTSNIHDDRGLHQPIYPGADNTRKTLYFGFIEFDYPTFTSDFSNPIDSREKLYQFMCWVNGVNGYSSHPGAEGNVTADIKANYNLWIPIGEANMIGATDPYTGTFHGNGHVISDLTFRDELYSHYGLFGTTEGANIDNLFIENFDFEKNTPGAMGLVVGNMKGGTLVNSTCSGVLTATVSDCIAGGMVGKLEKNGTAAGSIQSGYAGANITGHQMGGLVGDLAAGCSIYNSFANTSFSPQSGSTGYIGGLVGVNKGTVENCYSRVRGTVPGATYFGWLAGDNTNGSLVSSYIPTAYNNYTATNKTGTQTSLNKYAPVIAPYLYYRSGDNAVGTGNTLMGLLNSWVGTHSGYSPWKRTTMGDYQTGAGDINNDYPIHKHAGYKCAASTNGIELDYAANLDAMLTRHTTTATVNLWDHDVTTKGTGTGVVVCIDENISLKQSNTGSAYDIAAYTCQTIDGTPRSWHFVSSSLSGSGVGFNYDHYSAFNWSPDPCGLTFSTDNDHALFPSDMPSVPSMDLYAFYEPEYHWINLKRRSDSHWHMNETTVPITYANESDLEVGKGYLISIDQDQLLQNRGTLNNGDKYYALSYTPANAWAGLLGYNLIGNPYQSYFDFREFVNENPNLWYDNSKGHVEPTYAVYDASMGGYIQYKEGSSRGSKSASGVLSMHQGFMIRVSAANLRAHFTNDMRTNDGTGVTLREEQPAFPLVNLTVTDDEGVNDFAVLELGREVEEGAEKLRANDSKGWLYLRHNNESYGILFRGEVEDYQPLWFEADEDGTFTLSWQTANAEFEALTLIDNITGVTTDMLAYDRYVFEATTDQYASRFKIVVGEWKDVDEYNDDAHQGGYGNFAFVSDGNLVVNGEGSLQLFDVTGRCVYSTTLSGSQTMTALPDVTAGVYVLRLGNGNGTRTQKLIIE